jgi:hypothetical protein
MWIEIGAAWIQEIPILAVFYGMDVNDLEKTGQGKAVLEEINVVRLNDFNTYLRQLGKRIEEARK